MYDVPVTKLFEFYYLMVRRIFLGSVGFCGDVLIGYSIYSLSITYTYRLSTKPHMNHTYVYSWDISLFLLMQRCHHRLIHVYRIPMLVLPIDRLRFIAQHISLKYTHSLVDASKMHIYDNLMAVACVGSSGWVI